MNLTNKSKSHQWMIFQDRWRTTARILWILKATQSRNRQAPKPRSVIHILKSMKKIRRERKVKRKAKVKKPRSCQKIIKKKFPKSRRRKRIRRRKRRNLIARMKDCYFWPWRKKEVEEDLELWSIIVIMLNWKPCIWTLCLRPSTTLLLVQSS